MLGLFLYCASLSTLSKHIPQTFYSSSSDSKQLPLVSAVWREMLHKEMQVHKFSLGVQGCACSKEIGGGKKVSGISATIYKQTKSGICSSVYLLSTPFPTQSSRGKIYKKVNVAELAEHIRPKHLSIAVSLFFFCVV